MRVGYESMVSPSSVYDYDVASRSLTRLKVQEIPSGYDAALYETTRLDIPARDGNQVALKGHDLQGSPWR